MDDRIFPPSPTPDLTREAIIDVLCEWRDLGWIIYADNNDVFTICIAENHRVTISPSTVPGTWNLKTWGIGRQFGHASNAAELRARLANHAHTLNINWPTSPKTIRLVRGKPASNIGTIQRVIATSVIEAVYDIYLDDKGVDMLITLHNLGTKFDPELRLLSSAAKVPKELRKQFVSQAFIDLGCSKGEARYLDMKKGHEYRFMLLTGGRALVLGTSLNRMDVNEAPHLESDTKDRPLFENVWKTALPL